MIFTSPGEVLDYHEQHLAHGGVVIEALDARFGQRVQVHLDMDFSGKTHIIEGTVVSATSFGTALQVPTLPAEYLAFIDGLLRGEVPSKEAFAGTIDSGDESFADLDGDWTPPWDEGERSGDPAPSESTDVSDRPEPPGFSGAAEEEIDGAHITIGSGVTASGIFSDLPEMSEDGGLSEAPTLPLDPGRSDESGDAGASEAATVAIHGPAAGASTSFEVVIEDEDSEEFSFDGESLSQDDDSYSVLEEPVYATVQPAVQLGWAQAVADSPSDLQGKVQAKVINDVVRQLSARRLSGVLRMKLVNRLLVGIWFRGRPVHFIVSPPEDGKGAAEALAALPEIGAAEFERALERQQRSGGHLGTELLEMDAITLQKLTAVVRLEAQKYTSTLPMRRGGTFGFWECEVPAVGDGSDPDIEALLRWEASVFG